MKKIVLIIVAVLVALVVLGFIVTSVLAYFAGKAITENANQFVQETQENLGEQGNSSSNATGDSQENSTTTSENQGWPTVIPSDVPKLENVVIEGHYPLEEGAKAYNVSFAIDKKDSKYIDDYVAKLENSGYKQSLKDENDFGVDYYYSSTKYEINLNVVYGSASTFYVMIK